MAVPSRIPWAKTLIVGGVIVVLLLLYHTQYELFNQLEFKLVDAKFKFRGALQPRSPIALIAVDRKSIAQIGKWPWDRRLIARLVREISLKNPRVIAMNMLFASPDRDPGADAELARAFRDDDGAVIGCFFNLGAPESTVQGRADFDRELQLLQPFRIPLVTDVAESDVQALVAEAVEVEGNIPVISAAVSGCGYYNVCQERDGGVRRIPLIARAGNDLYAHFAAAVLKQYLGVKNLRVAKSGSHPLFLQIGSLRVPTDNRGHLFLNYHGPPRSFNTYPAWKLLAGMVPESALRGKVVLVGGTSSDDFQMLHTPFAPQLSSMELVATAIDNMLCGEAIRESTWSVELATACIVGFPLLLGLLVPRRGRTLLGFAVAVTCTALFLAVNFYFFSAAQLQMNTIYPLLAIFSSYLGLLLYNSMRHEHRSSRLIRSVNEVGMAMSGILDIGRLLPQVLDSMMEALEAHRGMLLTHDGVGEEAALRVVCQQRMPMAMIDDEGYSYVKEIIARVQKGGQSIFIDDVRHARDLDFGKAERGTVPSTIFCVPLKHGTRPLRGIVYMEKTVRGDDLWDEDIRLIDSMATQAAIAIENASMYSNLQKEEEKLREEVIHLKREIGETRETGYIVGKSVALTECLRLVDKAAASDITVLIEGETGSGKELIAKAIHFNGIKKDKLFIAQNCSALPEALLESELFGHKKGAFTGAVQDKKGLFEIANGGTIFLDEVADMSPGLQAKLLRVLQEGMIRAVGDVREKKADVRIISATNKDLQKEVKEGRFREDLYYRLNAFTIRVPTLRERREDIPLLVMRFIDKIKDQVNKDIKGITKEAMARLVAYDFPGNVRELENEIEKAVVMTLAGEAITARVLSEKITGANAVAEVAGPGGIQEDICLKDAIGILEKDWIMRALTRAGGNKSKAAKALGVSRLGLEKKIERLKLNV